jgi:signal transduction histidine kinase
VRPLDRLASIKLKLGVAIVAAVAVSSIVSTAGLRLGIPIWVRPLIAASIALLMIQVLARGMTSPLREMARAARAMAKGDHSMRVTATSRDEVGELARAFNQMAAELEQVDRQRRDLVANVSHELRTPIGALQAMLENIVDGVAPADPDVLKTMLRQVERLGRLVAQLLDLSRLESGAAPLQVTTFSVLELLEDVADQATLAVDGVPVDVDVAPVELSLRADSERVHQVVANLVENAQRFAPPGTTVSIHARPSNGSVDITVVDLGPGIPPSDVDRVFERFYRADRSRSSEGGGAGLGLAIAKWIVDMHDGQISCDPASDGCRMRVRLPRGER